jgi:hypothetical protein
MVTRRRHWKGCGKRAVVCFIVKGGVDFRKGHSADDEICCASGVSQVDSLEPECFEGISLRHGRGIAGGSSVQKC